MVFLDAVERRFIDELGGMNVFFVYDDDTLVTPPLTGTILPGITRDAILTLAAEAGHRVEERPVSFADWQADAASGRLREVFACGTAAVITPIGGVRFPDGEFLIGGGEPGRSPWRCGSSWWTSSAAGSRTRTAGCSGCSDPPSLPVTSSDTAGGENGTGSDAGGRRWLGEQVVAEGGELRVGDAGVAEVALHRAVPGTQLVRKSAIASAGEARNGGGSSRPSGVGGRQPGAEPLADASVLSA